MSHFQAPDTHELTRASLTQRSYIYKLELKTENLSTEAPLAAQILQDFTLPHVQKSFDDPDDSLTTHLHAEEAHW